MRLMQKASTNITVQFHEEYFRTRFVYDPRRDGIWREVVNYIQKLYIPEDSRVLDLGAGYCDFINHVVARERHAVDIFTKLEEWGSPPTSRTARTSRCSRTTSSTWSSPATCSST
jgi:hypothetical protein